MVRQEGDRLLLEGPVSMQTVSALRAQGASAIAAGQIAALDLSRVSELDSAALALVLAWIREAQQAGKSLTVTGVPAGFATLADLYGVSSLLSLKP